MSAVAVAVIVDGERLPEEIALLIDLPSSKPPSESRKRLTRRSHFWYCAIILIFGLLGLVGIVSTHGQISSGEVWGRSGRTGPIRLLGTEQDNPTYFYSTLLINGIGAVALCCISGLIVIGYRYRVRSDRNLPASDE